MNSLPAALFWLFAGLWLARAAGLPATSWGRLTHTWPVPYPQMRPAARCALRAAVAFGAAAAFVLAALSLPR